MDKAAIEEKVKTIIANMLNMLNYEITSESHLRNDLGMDSLDGTEMIMTIEEEFKITISDESAETIKTVGDLIDCVEKQIVQ